MKILVQKFGGTSVESKDKIKEVCKIIKSYKDNDKDLGIVVVVSAMGRKGAPYATDTLIGLFNEVKDKPQKRELDMLMSCGEIISGTILANMLQSYGLDSIFLTGMQAGIITNGNFSDARIRDVDPSRVLKELENKVFLMVFHWMLDYLMI